MGTKEKDDDRPESRVDTHAIFTGLSQYELERLRSRERHMTADNNKDAPGKSQQA